MRKIRVVVIGGGFAGINVIKSLRGAHLDVVLIDKKNHHLFQPLLYQVAGATLSPDNIATSLREIFSLQKNTSVIMGTVEKIDKKNQELVLVDGDKISYDYLVIAPGSCYSYFGNDQWQPFAPGLKTLCDALKMRDKILLAFEKAERIDSVQEIKKLLSFVIIGGGPTGVELAGSLAEIVRKTLFKNFRHINPKTANIYLIDAAAKILPSFPDKLSKRAHRDLEKMGVHIITDQMVTNLTEKGVYMEDSLIETENIFWAAGNRASPLLNTLDIPLDPQGRAIVEPDLSIPHHSEIFVIGDAALCLEVSGKPLPGIAPVAIQQGRYVGKVIWKKVAKENRKPFSYVDKGSIATIGKNRAVGYIRKVHVTGFFAWIIWSFVHVVYLSDYRSRFSVLFQWVVYYFSGLRTACLIYKSIDEEIVALKKRGKTLS